MGWIEAIVLGLVQGLTEFLPISSSAHVSIAGKLFFGDRDPGAAFTAISQLGTESAVLIYFRHDISRIIRRWLGALRGAVPRDDPDVRMGWLVIIGSVPITILGLAFQDEIETTARNLWLTAAMLIVFAVVIGVADRFAANRKELSDLSWRDGVLYGLAQSMALIPGVSRSGGTIAAGLAMGYRREAAARYSFLLAIPAVIGSGMLQLTEVADDPDPAWGPTFLATAIAFGVGYAVIAWLLRYISTHDFTPFVIYRIALGVVVLGLLSTGVVTA